MLATAEVDGSIDLEEVDWYRYVHLLTTPEVDAIGVSETVDCF